MNRVITLSDEQCRTIEQTAQSRGQTPESLLAQLIEELRDPQGNPHYYETDEWFRRLGMSDETVQNIKRSIRSEQECPHDADA